MSLKGSLNSTDAYPKLFVVFGLTLILAVTFSVLGLLLANAVYGINALSDPTLLQDFNNPVVISVMKLVQFCAALGTFILPAFLAAYLFDKYPAAYLGLQQPIKLKYFLMVFVLMFAMVPFINWMMVVNGNMHLPSFMKGVEDWMKSSEESAGKITEVFLNTPTISGLIANLIIIALLPAIGEELLFRGVVQRLLGEVAKNFHAGIIITAILFSAMHMQFYGFIPRFALGLLLGYLYIWSGSLWLPIFAHFINNAAAVIFTWMSFQHTSVINQDTIGTQPGEEMILGASVFLTWAIIFLIRKELKKEHPSFR